MKNSTQNRRLNILDHATTRRNKRQPGQNSHQIKAEKHSDANAQYMFDSMKLAHTDNLTPEQRTEKQREIEARHIEQSINITDWPARYQEFVAAKNNVLAASISEQEKQKQKQLQGLLRQHFASDELKRIKNLGLDQP